MRLQLRQQCGRDNNAQLQRRTLDSATLSDELLDRLALQRRLHLGKGTHGTKRVHAHAARTRPAASSRQDRVSDDCMCTSATALWTHHRSMAASRHKLIDYDYRVPQHANS